VLCSVTLTHTVCLSH